MKQFRSLLFLVAIVGSLVIFRCSNDANSANNNELVPTEYGTVSTFEELVTSAAENTITPTSLVVLFDNQTEENLLIGEAFTLEVNQDGDWYQVPVVIEEEFAFTSVGYDVPPNQITEWLVDWEWLYGELGAGEYRIIQEVLDVRQAGDYDQHWAATAFRIE